ncbi:hypothetical protein DITRI_Ditri15bG0137400 [Diplodiscus trichospermus]
MVKIEGSPKLGEQSSLPGRETEAPGGTRQFSGGRTSISLFQRRFFRWPDFDLSYLTSGWRNFMWSDFSIVDDVLWTFITVLESLALAAMLCFFFIFCGCTL